LLSFSWRPQAASFKDCDNVFREGWLAWLVVAPGGRKPGKPDAWRGRYSGSRDFRLAAGPGLVIARVSAARRARLAFPARRPAYAHFAAELDLLNAIMRARARRADMPRSSRILA